MCSEAVEEMDAPVAQGADNEANTASGVAPLHQAADHGYVEGKEVRDIATAAKSKVRGRLVVSLPTPNVVSSQEFERSGVSTLTG